uniref:Uncharacterized protein n=1 Tax=Oryza glumipatula TaxID=40148 RepID=A0A0D9ZZ00_9ORYZ
MALSWGWFSRVQVQARRGRRVTRREGVRSDAPLRAKVATLATYQFNCRNKQLFCEVDTSADLINNKTNAAVRRPRFIRVLLPGSFAKMPGEKKDGKGLNDRLWKRRRSGFEIKLRL